MLFSLGVTAVLLSLTGAALSASTPTAYSSSPPLPTVDLGYRLQRATVFNSTGQYYNFSNIRYAAPPTGNLRFRAPHHPQHDRSQVFTGEIDRICPQANPSWDSIVVQFLVDYFAFEKTGNYTSADFNETTITPSSLPVQNPRTTEDCLFLDVQVPKEIFEKRNSGTGKGGAPVLVWIYGGGYTAGSKGGNGNPAGMLARSEYNNNTGVIYVALNYRLGAFGWLAGPTLQEDGVANAGLYDQRFALEWVKKHISKFGGDPKRVTAIGESAGGGSIMHQITAFGGLKDTAPFQQAILQSPGFQPIVSTVVQENTTQAFLKLLNVSTVAQARALSFEALQEANILQVGASEYGSFTYGPVVDGVFAPQLPGQLLARGQFDKKLKVMVGHNANEGIIFTSPFISTSADLLASLTTFLPTAKAFPSVLSYITSVLYPPVSASTSYTNQLARAATLTAEASFTCNTYYLDKAFNNQTYAYLFAIPPAYHGQDLGYTFFNGGGGVVESVALALQEYITHFAEFGVPSESGVPYFPLYGKNATVQVLNATSIGEARDDAANGRCDWWQKALYY